MPFLGRTCVLVSISKVGTGTHGQRQSGTGTTLVVSVPNHIKGLVPVPTKVVPVLMLPKTLIFFIRALISPKFVLR